MTTHPRGVLAPTRRAFLLSTAAIALAGALPGFSFGDEPKQGGTLTVNIGTEPPVLVLIAHTAGAAVYLSSKTNEGLLTYDFDFTPKPLLATEWKVAEDGLRYWFKLREGVKFHDGTDFTAEDVAFSIQALKENHPRGRATFAQVSSINVLGTHEIELLLDKPSPYLLTALASSESPIVPKHLYEGTKIPENPHNVAPVGTGPFVFKEWVRGSYVLYERNPNYWEAPKPYLDKLVVRFIGDPAAAVASIETGEVLLSVGVNIPYTDFDRLQANPALGFETRGFTYTNSITRAEFNLENKYLANAKVRQAIAYAIDRNFIVSTIYLGHATALNGPVSPGLAAFFSDDLPKYAFDPAKAEALLDEAGFPRGDGGVRFELNIDPTQPTGAYKQSAEYIAQALNKVGIKTTVRTQDFATFVKRVYTDRDFDIALEGMSNLFDPTVGIQRLYWSKNFKPGVPFSNGAHYASAETDRLLEAAAVEPDPKKRFELFVDFQKQVVTDLPALDLVAPDSFVIFDKRVVNHTLGAEGFGYNGADIYLAS
ncbi:peptide/nickel transport system substrate-binding protein [Devosia sp. UYZn731]|uniref:ABC transporter substrate-binding protein n=1 Tax=Devosia sp. UYZn731 TaxID=3156345 RepID=UPI0033980FDF